MVGDVEGTCFGCILGKVHVECRVILQWLGGVFMYETPLVRRGCAATCILYENPPLRNKINSHTFFVDHLV